MFRARSVVEQLGPFGYHVYDAWNYLRSTWLRPPATAAQLDDAVAWLRERAPLRAGGRSFGAARGKNLIVVQVESLQDFVVDFAVDGQDVMPHLRGWTADSLHPGDKVTLEGWPARDGSMGPISAPTAATSTIPR